MLYFLNKILSRNNFTAINILLQQATNSVIVYIVDLIKAISLWKLVAKTKTDHLIKLKRNLM